MPENLWSCLFWAILSSTISQQLIKREDEKYKLSNKEQIFSYLIAIIFAICMAINYPKMNIIAEISIIGALSALSPSVIIDFKFQELPNRATALSLIFSLLTFYFLYGTRTFQMANIYSVLIGMFVVFLILFTGNLGGGDVKMCLPLLITLQSISWKTPITAFAYSLITSIVYIILKMGIYDKLIKGHKKAENIKEEKTSVQEVADYEQNNVTTTENTSNTDNLTEEIKNELKDNKDTYNKHLFAFGPFLILGSMIAFFSILF